MNVNDDACCKFLKLCFGLLILLKLSLVVCKMVALVWRLVMQFGFGYVVLAVTGFCGFVRVVVSGLCI